MVAKTYWEDLREGQKLPCKTVKIKKAEIKAFAQKYDPQPFHVDERAARNSIFGGLIASALHTLSACTRAVVDAQGNVAILSGLGLDEAKMLNPVRPGDLLSIDATWVDLKRSRSKPHRGFAGIRCKVTNQKGKPVTEYGYRYLIACKTKD